MKRSVVCLLSWFGLVVQLGGCVAASRSNLGPAPRDPSIARIVVSVTPTSDSDADGSLDTFQASVHMFDATYQAPLSAPGQVTFELIEPGSNRQLYRWSFDEAAVEDARQAVQVGIVHWFELRLDTAVSRWMPRVTDLRVVFRGADAPNPIAQVHRGIRWSD